MSVSSFISSTRGKVILATVAALHMTIYFAKPSLFKGESVTKSEAAPPRYLPEK